MAQESKVKASPAVIKRRITSAFTIPGNAKLKREIMVCKVGDEVTASVRKNWEAWQKEANSEGNININGFTS